MSRYTPWPSSLMLACLLLIGGSCTTEPEVHYGLQPLELASSTADKDRVKTIDQWISILHADLFGTALGSAELFDIKQAFQSVGDQEVARESLVASFMQNPDVQLPALESMLTNPDNFVEEAYVRFLVRYPTQAERTWMRNYIQNTPTVTPELVYSSFALSTEYLHY
ncbi:MAG: hypothetical protein L7S67_10095 [Flavobacteriales bacterium]|nr:hypothetical protein [Flavobacteriales bacterium]